MPRTSRKLDALAALLERTNGDPKRIEAVRRAQGFRRSWIDLAETLCRIRNQGLFEKWGFSDFHEYCQEELTLKRATVDKLTISYSTLERHAPQVLERDGVANTIPSYEAIDYFHKTVGEFDEPPATHAANDGEGEEELTIPRRGRVPLPPTPELRREFEQAVFDEGQPVGELRKRFDQHFFPRPSGADELDSIRKASATARKLAALIVEIPGLPEKQVRRVEAELGKLREALDDLVEPLEDKVAKATARADKKAIRAREALTDEGEPEAPRAAAPRKRKAAG
ncbi:hypothetical protein ACNOYE_35185 [Nannocystaceae bacterium ST9]